MKKRKSKSLKPAAPELPTLFFESFIGELVSVTTKLSVTESMSSEQGHMEAVVPLTIQSYLLDEDDEYYFLGDSPEEVSQAIKKSEVSHIEIVISNRHKHPYDELLDDMPNPKKITEFN